MLAEVQGGATKGTCIYTRVYTTEAPIRACILATSSSRILVCVHSRPQGYASLAFNASCSLCRCRYVDDTHYSTQVSGRGTQSEGTWFSLVENAGSNSPFDKPFHILLNLALGGGFSGNPSYEEVAPTLQEPKRMLVDYVRVFGWQ